MSTPWICPKCGNETYGMYGGVCEDCYKAVVASEKRKQRLADAAPRMAELLKRYRERHNMAMKPCYCDTCASTKKLLKEIE